MKNYVETPLVSNANEMTFNFNQMIIYESITQVKLYSFFNIKLLYNKIFKKLNIYSL